jgi:hypothetical protein
MFFSKKIAWPCKTTHALILCIKHLECSFEPCIVELSQGWGGVHFAMLPSFSDISKGDSDNTKVIFNWVYPFSKIWWQNDRHTGTMT